MKFSLYIKSTLVLLVLIFSFIFSKNIFRFLSYKIPAEIITKNPSDGFIIYIYISVILSLVVLFPFLLSWAIQYIKPALYKKEQITLSRILRLGYFSLFLFFLGVIFGYYIIFYTILPFLISFNESIGIQNIWDASNTVLFVFLTLFYSGLIFQTPIVVYYFLKWEILDIEKISIIRKVFIVVALIIGSIITPPDVLSQIIFSLPIWLLFELSVLYWRIKNGIWSN